MKTIGETRGGTVLLEMSKADFSILRKMVQAVDLNGVPTLDDMPGLPLAVPIAPPKVELREEKPKSTGRRKAKKSQGEKTDARICVSCGKELKGKQRKACSAKCKQEAARQYQREWYNRKRKKTEPAGAEKNAIVAAEKVQRCSDCGTELDNPKKKVCDGCAAKRISAANRLGI